jgi:hypothetical protein
MICLIADNIKTKSQYTYNLAVIDEAFLTVLSCLS